MDYVEYVLVVVNLLAGFGFAFPMARVLAKVAGRPTKAFRYYTRLVGIYLLESIVLMMGMGIPVLNVGLAFVWGIVFGRWLRTRSSRNEALRTSFWVALYSSLPAVSFILVPVMAWLGGWNILSTQDGPRFGIPEFFNLLPPMNTILGFYVAVATGALVLKAVITVGEVSLLIGHGEKSAISTS